MARRQPEQALQSAVAEYLGWVLPPSVFWTAIGHGGGGPVRGAILKAMGLRPGVPDLFLVTQGKAHFIEMKAPRGQLSPAQREAHAAIVHADGKVAVCRSIDEVADQLDAWCILLKARAA